MQGFVYAESILNPTVAIANTVAQKAVTEIPAVESGEYHSTPTPKSIFKRIEEMPPYQRPAVVASYVGLKVRWLSARFTDIDLRNDEGGDYLLLRHEGILISSYVHVSEYPRLKITKVGDLIHIEGTISDVDTSIRLKDVRLSFST